MGGPDLVASVHPRWVTCKRATGWWLRPRHGVQTRGVDGQEPSPAGVFISSACTHKYGAAPPSERPQALALVTCRCAWVTFSSVGQDGPFMPNRRPTRSKKLLEVGCDRDSAACGQVPLRDMFLLSKQRCGKRSQSHYFLQDGFFFLPFSIEVCTA